MDISPLMDFLKRAQEEGKEYFVWLAAQTDPGWNAPTLEATPEGGTVPVPNSGFPVIGQLAKLEQGKSQVTFQRNLMVSAASLNGVTVGFAADNKAMEAKFAKRLYQPLENEVILTIQGTGTDQGGEGKRRFFYAFQISANLRQDSLYQASLDHQNTFAIIDTSQGDSVSETITGTIQSKDGRPVKLKSVDSVILYAYQGNSLEENITATNVTWSGNTFSFQVQKEKDWSGSRYVTPAVTYQLEGGEEESEMIPRSTVSFLLFVGNKEELKVDQIITFHMDQASGGKVTSQPVRLDFPGEMIKSGSSPTLWSDSAALGGNAGVQQKDGTWVFTLPTDQVDQVIRFQVILFTQGSSATYILYIPVTVQKIYPDTGSDPLPPSLTQRVENAPEGSTVKTTLAQGQQVDEKTLEALAGRDVTLEVKSGDVTLRIHGEDVPKDAALPPLTARGVLDGDAVPSETVESLGAGLECRTLSLTNQEEFGYPVEIVLSFPEQEGIYANLYRYEENGLYGPQQGNTPVFQQSVPLSGEGEALFTVEKGGDYVILFDEISHRLPFFDVEPTDWFQEDVRYVWRRGWMLGMENGDFAPQQSLTRAQLMQILYNQAGCPPVTGQRDFSDVQATGWYWEAVQWGAQQGVTQGYEDGSFRPNEPITRQQMAVMLHRFHQGTESTSLAGFSDGNRVASWAEEAMEWAVDQGILEGMSDGILNPQGSATRAQSAAMFRRIAQKIE